MEARGDLNEPVYEDAVVAGELAPDVLPPLVRLKEFPGVERGAPRREPGVERRRRCGRLAVRVRHGRKSLARAAFYIAVSRGGGPRCDQGVRR
jgi:hypothetical protein